MEDLRPAFRNEVAKLTRTSKDDPLIDVLCREIARRLNWALQYPRPADAPEPKERYIFRARRQSTINRKDGTVWIVKPHESLDADATPDQVRCRLLGYARTILKRYLREVIKELGLLEWTSNCVEVPVDPDKLDALSMAYQVQDAQDMAWQLEEAQDELLFVQAQDVAWQLQEPEDELLFVQNEATPNIDGTYGPIELVLRRAVPAQVARVRTNLAQALAILLEGWSVTRPVNETLLPSWVLPEIGHLIEKYRVEYRYGGKAQLGEKAYEQAYQRAKKALQRAMQVLEAVSATAHFLKEDEQK